MAILKQGNTTLNAGAKGDKGDTGSLGVAIPVTNLTELQVITSNQIASIQENIDLTSTTLNIPSGVILRFEGGTITNGTLNGDSTYIWSDEQLQIFGLDITFTGTWKYRAVFPEWFGGGISATDNILPFRKVIELIDLNGGGKIEVNGNGYYDFSSQSPGGYWGANQGANEGKEGIIELHDNTEFLISQNSTLRVVDDGLDTFEYGTITDVTSLTITSNTTNNQKPVVLANDEFYINDVYLGKKVSSTSVSIITFDSFAFTPQVGDVMYIKQGAIYDLIKFDNSKNTIVRGGHIKGNIEISGASEGPSGFSFYGLGENIVVENVEVSYFPSDGFHSNVENNFGADETNVFESGGIITSGEFAGDNDDSKIGEQIRSTTKWDLTETKIVENGKFMFGDQFAFSQINQVPEGRLSMFFYNASDVFQGARLSQNMYEYVVPPTGSTYVRVTMEATDIDAQYRIDAQAREFSRNVNVKNCDIHHNGRQGLSTSYIQGLTIDNCDIHDTGGVAPGAGIDIEDGSWANRRITVVNNTFWNNNGGGLVLYNTPQTIIKGNKFLRSTNSLAETNAFQRGIVVTQRGSGIIISENFFEHTENYIVKNCIWDNNIFKDSKIEIQGGTIKNNKLTNVEIKLTASSDDRYAAPIIIEGNHFENDVLAKSSIGLTNTISMSTVLDAAQYPSFLKNNIIIGADSGNTINIKDGLIVDNLTLIDVNQPRIESSTVNGLKSNVPVYIWYNPADNNFTIYEDWKIIGEDVFIAFRGSTNSVNNFEFNNLTIDTERLAFGMYAIDVDNNLGSLIIRNSKIIDRGSTATNFFVINFDNTVDKFRMLNTEVVTATAGNLLDKGTSTEDTTWIYKDCIFDTVVLNNTLGIEVNNIINDVYTP